MDEIKLSDRLGARGSDTCLHKTGVVEFVMHPVLREGKQAWEGMCSCGRLYWCWRELSVEGNMTPLQTPQQAWMDEAGFREWVEGLDGNVYRLWKEYLEQSTKEHAEVGLNWFGIEPVHMRENGVWVNFAKLPKWFNRWVIEVGVGKYGTRKVAAKKGVTNGT